MPNSIGKFGALSPRELSEKIGEEEISPADQKELKVELESRIKAGGDEIPSTERIKEAYDWSEQRERSKLSELLLSNAMERRGFNHLGRIESFESPPPLDNIEALDGNGPPSFLIKDIEVDGEPTNEALIICKLHSGEKPEDTTLVLAQVSHNKGKLDKVLLTSTIDGKMYNKARSLEDLQLVDSESFDLRTRAVGAFLRGKTTANDFKEDTFRKLTDPDREDWVVEGRKFGFFGKKIEKITGGMTLDEYNRVWDNGLRTERKVAISEEVRPELIAGLEKTYTEALQRLSERIDETEKMRQEKVAEFEKAIQLELKDNKTVRYTFITFMISENDEERKFASRSLPAFFGNEAFDYLVSSFRDYIEVLRNSGITNEKRKSIKNILKKKYGFDESEIESLIEGSSNGEK